MEFNAADSFRRPSERVGRRRRIPPGQLAPRFGSVSSSATQQSGRRSQPRTLVDRHARHPGDPSVRRPAAGSGPLFRRHAAIDEQLLQLALSRRPQRPEPVPGAPAPDRRAIPGGSGRASPARCASPRSIQASAPAGPPQTKSELRELELDLSRQPKSIRERGAREISGRSAHRAPRRRQAHEPPRVPPAVWIVPLFRLAVFRAETERLPSKGKTEAGQSSGEPQEPDARAPGGGGSGGQRDGGLCRRHTPFPCESSSKAAEQRSRSRDSARRRGAPTRRATARTTSSRSAVSRRAGGEGARWRIRLRGKRRSRFVGSSTGSRSRGRNASTSWRAGRSSSGRQERAAALAGSRPGRSSRSPRGAGGGRSRPGRRAGAR